MKFHDIEYMQWAKDHPKPDINLCSSGMPRLTADAVSIKWDEIELDGDNGYGYEPLLQSAADRYGVEQNQVVPAVGTSNALFMICAAVLSEGDAALVEFPAYEPLIAVPSAFGSEIHRVKRRFSSRYALDAEAVAQAVTARTKLIILSNLHNPSGVLCPPEILTAVAEIAARNGALVCVDEVYLEFLDEDPKKTSFHLADNILVISSLTKVFGLGGLRCGWILAPKQLADKLRIIMDYVYVEKAFPSERIAAQVFPQLDAIKAGNKELIRRNHALVDSFIQQRPELSWVEPDGGIVGFPRIHGNMDGSELAGVLERNYAAGVVPGRFFEQPRHFRLGFGVETGVLESGLDRIGQALEARKMQNTK
jgi:aspartate/methionine/tyrosine aminotransferase